jgi:hypothetical protein
MERAYSNPPDSKSENVNPPTVLDPWLQEMEYCPKCGGPQIFVFAWEFEGGRVGCCLGCGDERIARFTRTNSEAA